MSRTCRPSIRVVLACLSVCWLGHGAAFAAPSKTDAAAGRLRDRAGADARITMNPATGMARFVSVPAGDLSDASGAPADKSAAFFRELGGAFGVKDPASELVLRKTATDAAGMTHLDYGQVYGGVPVFAGVLKTHFDATGALRTVNGVFVPDLNLNPIPLKSAADAGRIALALVKGQRQAAVAPSVRASKLYVYRENLAKGVPGANHLAWEVEVGNAKDVREFVYVDAHDGKVVDQVSGIQEALTRRVYDGGYGPTFIVWNEGDPFPTGDVDINNIITYTFDTYHLYFDVFGRDSYTGQGTLMETVNDDPTINCPNANWNGISTNYCTGVTGDDTVAHEWTHAVTQYTHGLIYAWQPGALNESYSDIFGETVDVRNGANMPDNPRTAGNCTTFAGAPAPSLTVTGGSGAGSYFVLASVNEPPLPWTVGPTQMGLAVPASACSPVTGVSGRIAVIDFTLLPDGTSECNSSVRATNALNAGATGIIFVAPPSGFLNLGSIAAIASVQVSNTDGTTIKNGLPANATIAQVLGSDNSYRWLSGEDDTSLGAIRDLWNPNCFGDPGQVAAGFYTCATADGGGVHTNSGVPNHAYALLVDGGTYNGHTVGPIGITKAAWIYYRAMTTYQHPSTSFADHADALEQSCTDLIGVPLTAVLPGPTQTIAAADCTQVHEAMLATNMRTPPTFCNFQPLLAAGDPPLCPAGQGLPQTFYFDDFENAPAWTTGRYGTTPDFSPRDWTWVGALPSGRPGKAFFAPDPDIGTCAAGGDESAVLTVTSPAITVPAGPAPRLAFDHWIASEFQYDGGNVKISVNGGPYTLVADADYTFNSYNDAVLDTDPMAGQAAFTGTDGGSVGGSWGRSTVNLAPYASAGQTVQLRFDFGTDGCTGFQGWYIDDIRLYSCVGTGGTPALAIGDSSVVEGNSGTTGAGFTVTMSQASGTPVTVNFATANGTATTANNDYTAQSGTLTFTPGQLTRNVTVSVVGDTTFEPNENFFVNLSAPVGATILDGQGEGTIVNDDTVVAAGGTHGELIHGTVVRSALTPVGTAQGRDFYRINVQMFKSYEVVVDETSGDIGGANGPDLDRMDFSGTNVISSSQAIGTGSSRSLRWISSTSGVESVRVQSNSCTTNCGADDVYRLRSYETTYTIPRFNNAGTQVTVLLLQNPTNYTINAEVYFWPASGGITPLSTQTFTLTPKSLTVLNTSTVPALAGQGGTVTIAHNARYGDLAGKTVALEPSTGFSFDSPMVELPK